MRISIHTLGTRGDIQPYLALSRGLLAAGHEVQIAGPEQFTDLVAGHGVAFAPLPREFLDLIETPEARDMMGKSKGFAGGFKLLRQFRPMMLRLLAAEWEASRSFGEDLLLYHPKALAAPHIAEARGIPAVLASPLPGFTPTGAFPTPLLPFASLGPLNKASHSLMIRAGGVMFGRELADLRETSLRLPRKSTRHPWRGVPTLYAYSPAIVPVPADWGRDVRVTGFWFLDDETNWAPSPELAAFLAAGPAPVYVGFGSMPIPDPAAVTRTIAEAAAMAGQRVVLASGWGRLGAGDLPPHVLSIDSAPHDRLFPLMGAVVHHGGAGTTAAGLRAGKPTVICPFFGDQPFWGRRVAELGAGPRPVSIGDLSTERLANLLRDASQNPAYRQNAAALGAAIQDERGVDDAVAFIEAIGSRGAAAA
jgi:sterol 3beta-glucosyltransferase